MKKEVQVVKDQVLVTLSGGIYVEDAAELREQFIGYIDQGHKNFIMNMAGVDYIDSSGLGVLVAIQKRALQHGGGVTLRGLQGLVKELIELTRLNKVFVIE
ncbi:anti-sigma factor antagonist [Lucifera butyrica]|uniref:Anti-sigma factor antagonist n=1 Tax=Lucifera butyrica TaxID=1351585 RepID=A0A498QY20_9FIRM|nr:STAS domain-containing protein [Lucifera butyrica]VBB05056.1 anti-sigma factor antagonist [Lucifera butyrica]